MSLNIGVLTIIFAVIAIKRLIIELKNQLLTKENGAYTLKMHSGIPSDNQVVTTWERSIDKIRLDKDSINIMVKSNDVDRVQEVQSSSSFAPKKEDEPTNEKIFI